MTSSLTPKDLEQLDAIGISPAEVQRQLELFRRPPPPARLLGPCILGDGIVRLTETEQERFIERWQTVARRRGLAKFVPASGAATRMFKDLTASASPTEARANSAAERLVDALPRFAFSERLAGTLDDSGATPVQAEAVVRALLGPAGLGYGAAPKGLILFHRYPGGPRTAMEDQIREGLGYLTVGGGRARYHFTVSPDHEQAFQQEAERFEGSDTKPLEIGLDITFSTQSPATDTVAVGTEHRLVRLPDGGILLRPAGHGALLDNLQSVDTDIVFVKNIDNISHERLHPDSIRWKQVLAGYFAAVQDTIFSVLEALAEDASDVEAVERGLEILQRDLAVRIPDEIADADSQVRSRYVQDRLDRPLRVCGMVRNEGEPGGGPFWLPSAIGAAGQIVESAQVDHDSPEQMEIWAASTHFNPVDLVCGLRDRRGQAYRLADYVDAATSFVAEKSFHGQTIKALERPGLWNGSMAGWNTAFVEVPLTTFTPVKTIFDLLRAEHQP